MLGAGEVVDGIIDARVSEKTEATVKFEPDRINHFLGTNIPEDRMISILRGLLFQG